jgi:K+-transporting ATPase ATPase C chain
VRKDIISSIVAVVVFTVLLGLAYPLVVTGVAQVAFPGAANGSKITRDGVVVGSRLIGQDFAGRAGYFQSRPSVTGYAPDATYFNNRGPNQASLAVQQRRFVLDYLARERPFVPGLQARDVPADAATTSASGVDPHISRTNARIQAHRVAATRRLPMARVLALVDANTDGRGLGFLGEPGVDVLELNLALDAETR